MGKRTRVNKGEFMMKTQLKLALQHGFVVANRIALQKIPFVPGTISPERFLLASITLMKHDVKQ
jgi:hypothetical protein